MAFGGGGVVEVKSGNAKQLGNSVRKLLDFLFLRFTI